MTQRFAILDGSTVANVILATDGFVQRFHAGAFVEVPDGVRVAPGDTWTGSSFIPGAPNVPEPGTQITAENGTVI